MKKTILAAAAILGFLGLMGSTGSAVAGGSVPQDHWTWQYEEAIETGFLPAQDAGKATGETVRSRAPAASSDAPDFDSDPRWEESGGE